MIICEGNDLAMWLLPDPAEQFANPYLAMGNNPVVYVDPDGEWTCNNIPDKKVKPHF